MEHVTVSVRELVSFFFCEGDISLTGPAGPVLEEGVRIHGELQKDRPGEYIPEYPVATVKEGEYVRLKIQGRIDGLIPEAQGLVIEEIKSTSFPLEALEEMNIPEAQAAFPEHWAQAKLYGALLIRMGAQDPAGIPFPLELLSRPVTLRLLYAERLSGETVEMEQTFTSDDLTDFFNVITDGYLEWAESIGEWQHIRSRSLPSIRFPFPAYRPGQEVLIREAEEAITNSGMLYIHAPTGIGKTVGVLFPAIKSLKEAHGRKIFYLTAKSSGKEIAEKTLSLLRDRGLRLKSITLTAKSRICFLRNEFEGESPPCDPEICPYAKGYYGKVKQALKAVFDTENLTREVIEDYARNYQVCPFELSLDASLACDLIICDYNYVFDPRVRLVRYFQKRGKYLFLVDEAHNLIDRGRSMFSATIEKRDAMALKKVLAASHKPMAQRMGDLNSLFLAIGRELRGPSFFREYPEELKPILDDWVKMFDWNIKTRRHMPPEAYDFYYTAQAFLKVLSNYSEAYRTLIQPRTGRNMSITLSCIDPSAFLLKGLKLASSSLLFSATLTPIDYHKNLISAGKGAVLELDSPFPKEHRRIILDPTISTLYRDRDRNGVHIARRLGAMALARQGNYMAFFPSYAFLAQVELHLRREYGDRLRIETQTRSMGDGERSDFLSLFDNPRHTSLLALSVMGGLFGEGIDLTGDKLKGAAVIGVGLPQLGPERDIIKDYFDEHANTGFDYAYTYPGFCKVLQAAGRVIRTETDTGVILYIGSRFSRPSYLDLFPGHMYPDCRVTSQDDMISSLHEFWDSIEHKKSD
ncbi:MAG: ATP-dependent DNA helicase, partial [Spirochaetales bacterium]|nr:ATP-dependent DNA helicase [Spirochaetales bacterium]